MKIFDLILVNFYKFLKIIHLNIFSNNNDVKLHAFILFSTIQSINMFSIIGILYFFAFSKVEPEVFVYIAFISPLIFNYIIYYKKKRFDKIISSELMNNNIIHYLLTFVYVVVTIYLMNLVSNYIRTNYLKIPAGPSIR
jgi:hypothetical protein